MGTTGFEYKREEEEAETQRVRGRDPQAIVSALYNVSGLEPGEGHAKLRRVWQCESSKAVQLSLMTLVSWDGPC